MLPSLASVEDLEARMGRTLDSTRAQSLLSAGSTRIRAFTGRVWVDSDGPQATEFQLEVVREVCVSYAQRVYSNPDGATQQTSGPYSKSVRDWSAAGPRLSPEEMADLEQVRGGVPGLSSVRVTAPRGTEPSRRFRNWFGEVNEADG